MAQTDLGEAKRPPVPVGDAGAGRPPTAAAGRVAGGSELTRAKLRSAMFFLLPMLVVLFLVAGWPLGPATRHSGAVMENLIGAEADRWPALAADPTARLHLYGKAETREGRKMGHVTRLG